MFCPQHMTVMSNSVKMTVFYYSTLCKRFPSRENISNFVVFKDY